MCAGGIRLNLSWSVCFILMEDNWNVPTLILCCACRKRVGTEKMVFIRLYTPNQVKHWVVGLQLVSTSWSFNDLIEASFV